MNEWAQVVRSSTGLSLIGLGLIFSLIGVLGLFRMLDIYSRMHAGSKAVTFGSSAILIGVAILSPFDVALKALGTTVLLLLTTPMGAFALARAAHRLKARKSGLTAVDELQKRKLEDDEERA